MRRGPCAPDGLLTAVLLGIGAVRVSRRTSVSGLPTWAIWSIIAVPALLSPVLAFLLAIAVAILIGALKDAGVPALLATCAALLTGWLLARKLLAGSRSGDRSDENR